MAVQLQPASLWSGVEASGCAAAVTGATNLKPRAGDRNDVFVLAGALAQHLANRRDALIEVVFLDNRAGPYGLEQYILGQPARRDVQPDIEECRRRGKPAAARGHRPSASTGAARHRAGTHQIRKIARPTGACSRARLRFSRRFKRISRAGQSLERRFAPNYSPQAQTAGPTKGDERECQIHF